MITFKSFLGWQHCSGPWVIRVDLTLLRGSYTISRKMSK